VWSSVANSFQDKPARLAENLAAEKKFGSFLKFTFFFSCLIETDQLFSINADSKSVKSQFFCCVHPKGKAKATLLFRNSAPIRLFLGKYGPNSAVEIFG
jgi:hypothetical protein